MFDRIQPAEWVDAMSNFSDYEVEFYMWGGEPFCIDGTFDLVKGFSRYDFVKWARIDSNLTFTKKILSRCPSNKVKLLCSWHTEFLSFDKYWERVNKLKERDMVGMANFVASDFNMRFLEENNLVLDDLIERFSGIGVFFNIAGDFSKSEVPGYKQFITKYMTEDDWMNINGKVSSLHVSCNSGDQFFSIGMDGAITTCGRQIKSLFGKKSKPEIVGNFFEGTLKRVKEVKCPHEFCRSIVSYPHRLDNTMMPMRHIEDYIRRNREHRKKTGVVN